MQEVGWTVNGSRIHACYHGPAKPRKAVVMMHGFRSSMAELGPLPEVVGDHGYGALAIDLRGHGGSAGEPGRINLERAMEDVEAALAWLRAEKGRMKVALVGHSLGGALALGIASRTDHFESIVAAHPVRNLFEEIGLIERGFFHALGRYGNRRMRKGKAAGAIPKPPRAERGYEDKAAGRAAVTEGYLQPKVNIANYSFALTMDAAHWASKVKVPVLGIQSDHDRVVKPAHTEAVLAAIDAPLTRVRHDGGHACFRDRDRNHVITSVTDFLKETL